MFPAPLVVQPQSRLVRGRRYFCAVAPRCHKRSGKSALRWVSLAAKRFVLVTFIICQFDVSATSYQGSGPRVIAVLLTSVRGKIVTSLQSQACDSSWWVTLVGIFFLLMEQRSQRPPVAQEIIVEQTHVLLKARVMGLFLL